MAYGSRFKRRRRFYKKKRYGRKAFRRYAKRYRPFSSVSIVPSLIPMARKDPESLGWFPKGKALIPWVSGNLVPTLKHLNNTSVVKSFWNLKGVVSGLMFLTSAYRFIRHPAVARAVNLMGRLAVRTGILQGIARIGANTGDLVRKYITQKDTPLRIEDFTPLEEVKVNDPLEFYQTRWAEYEPPDPLVVNRNRIKQDYLLREYRLHGLEPRNHGLDIDDYGWNTLWNARKNQDFLDKQVLEQAVYDINQGKMDPGRHANLLQGSAAFETSTTKAPQNPYLTKVDL